MASTELSTVMVDGIPRTGFTFTCAKCGKVGFMPSSKSAPLPAVMVRRRLIERGWEIGSKKALCPDHAKHRAKPARKLRVVEKTPDNGVIAGAFEKAITHKLKTERPSEPARRAGGSMVEAKITEHEEMAAEPTPKTVVPELDAASKRRIFREIDDNWSDSTGRYIGSACDSGIARKLNVPKAWVTQIRADNFGEHDGDDEVSKALTDISKLQGEVSGYLDDAITMASKFEKVSAALTELRRRVSAM